MEQGNFIGPYELRGELGRGAMAKVWRAWDPKLERELAIKEPLFDERLSDEVLEEMGARFIKEGKAAARLNHPGIVTIYAAEVYDGKPVIVMELVDGITLGDMLEAGALAPQVTLDILCQLLDAAGYAHSQGVVHRDIKPDNIFISKDGRVKLSDFGIARLEDTSQTKATQVGTMLGTPGYMAPEQVQGTNVDKRADLFSIGTIAHEMLTGTNPFGAGSGADYTTLLYRIVHAPTPELPEISGEGLPADIRPAILAALNKNPADRPQDAASFRAMLQGASVPAASTIIAPAAPFQQTPSMLKSKKMLPYALVGGVGVLVIALVFVFANSDDTGAGSGVGAQGGVGAEEHVAKNIESEVSLSIFLADEAVDADVAALINFIHSLPGVSNVTYIDKDQALENFKEMTSSGIVEQLEGNPLPASLEIDLADPDQVEAVASAIQSEPVYVRVVDNPANPADSIKYRLQNVGGMGGTDLEDALISVTEVMNQAYATASSQLADDRDPNTNTSFNYNPANVLDGSINTCWCPGSNNAGIGQWVKINLPQEAEVQGFTIYNGMWRLEDRLQQNARVRGVTVSFSDGSSETFILQDPVNGQFASGRPERITFQKPHPTYSVTFTIDSVYPGSRWDDTCIAGIGLF